ncbi:hypothetical protein [Shewanella xiamenensis]|uniref:Type IV pilus biogenesis protein PilP n=1 Tax=Shewanella xiamenensis TaxID=332186 RepID=A0ABT6UGW7_9GAMM|nr:hypothetical protein [Shewanella xiamenensis]MDI5833713.1 hypothetical protein [Shewanella xiamenensis]
MIKQNAKWIVLAIVAVPVLIFSVGPMLSGSDIPIQEISTYSEETVYQSTMASPMVVEAPPQPVVVTPPVDMSIELDRNALAVISKTNELNLKNLDVALEEAKAREREAKLKFPSFTDIDMLGLGSSTPVGTVNAIMPLQSVDILSQVTLNSLITSGGETSAYLSIDGIAPVRVTKGSDVGGVKVVSVTDKGVTVSFDKKTRFLAGGSYE